MRVFGWAGAEPDAHRRPMIHAAWVVVSLHVAVRLTLSVWYAESFWLLPGVALLFAVGLLPRMMRPAASVLAGIQCVRFALTYPDVSNHYLVEVVCVAIFAAVDLDREEERDLCLRALCWLAALVLFMSGLQKALHGSYFQGEFLAYMVSGTDRFRDFFSPILSAGDLEHLRSLEGAMDSVQFRFDQPVGPMPGPFRVDSTPFVLVANAIWIGEMVVAVGLLVRRVRKVALIGAVLLMIGIVASSREFFFDTLFLNLLLLFAGTAINRKLLPLSVASYLYYLLGGLGVIHVGFVW
jgi:hypothetical protein